jgi:hypothetical protein
VAAPLLPDNPDDWSDEQWLAWLREGDEADRAGQPVERSSLPSWRKAPLAVQFLAVSMTVIGEAIYGRHEQPAIVVDAPGDPPNDDGLDLQLDFDHPERSVAVVSRWRAHIDDGEREIITE